jgi:hypothetical protein
VKPCVSRSRLWRCTSWRDVAVQPREAQCRCDHVTRATVRCLRHGKRDGDGEAAQAFAAWPRVLDDQLRAASGHSAMGVIGRARDLGLFFELLRRRFCGRSEAKRGCRGMTGGRGRSRGGAGASSRHGIRDSSSRSSGKRSKSLIYDDGTLLLLKEEFGFESCALRGGLSELREGQDGNAQDMLLLQAVLMVQFMDSVELVLDTEEAAEFGEFGEVPGHPIDMGEEDPLGDPCEDIMMSVLWDSGKMVE